MQTDPLFLARKKIAVYSLEKAQARIRKQKEEV